MRMAKKRSQAKHDWKCIDVGNCYSEYQCSKCKEGFVEEPDSDEKMPETGCILEPHGQAKKKRSVKLPREPKGDSWAGYANAFLIFAEYGEGKFETCAKHDTIYAGPNYEEVSIEDREALEKLGWYENDFGTFQRSTYISSRSREDGNQARRVQILQFAVLVSVLLLFRLWFLLLVQTAMVTAQACLDDYGLPNAVVVDVGVIKDAGPAVLEANPAWGSGIYGCKPEHVLPVIMASVSSFYLENQEE